MICHVYKRGRLYWGKLKLDTDSKVSRVALSTTDKRVAVAKLVEMAKIREKEAAGLLAPSSVREAAGKPLGELLEAFLLHRRGERMAASTCTMYRGTLTKLFQRCHWRTFADVTEPSFNEWWLNSTLSPKTKNNLLGQVQTFLRWLVHQRAASLNPLSYVRRISTRGTWVQYRRALTHDELRRLLDNSPPHRRIVYLTAAYTGLRRTELRMLRWGDIILDQQAPQIRVRSSTTKNGKEASLPIHSDLAAALCAIRPVDVAPFTPIFNVPKVPTLRRDLLSASVPFEDEQGRRVDMHALRVTYGTNLTLSGATPRVVMELMRHSDIKLTMRVYTDAGKLPLTDAVKSLPSVLSLVTAKQPDEVLVRKSIGI